MLEQDSIDTNVLEEDNIDTNVLEKDSIDYLQEYVGINMNALEQKIIDDNLSQENRTGTDVPKQYSTATDLKVQDSKDMNAPERNKIDIDSLEQYRIERDAPEQDRIDVGSPDHARIDMDAPMQDGIDIDSPDQNRIDMVSPEHARTDMDASEQAKMDSDSPVHARTDMDAPEQARIDIDTSKKDGIDIDFTNENRIDMVSPEHARTDMDAPEQARMDSDSPEHARTDMDAPEQDGMDTDAPEQARMDSDSLEHARIDTDAPEQDGIHRVHARASKDDGSSVNVLIYKTVDTCVKCSAEELTVYSQSVAVESTDESGITCTADTNRPAYYENIDVEKAADAVTVKTEEYTLELDGPGSDRCIIISAPADCPSEDHPVAEQDTPLSPDDIRQYCEKHNNFPSTYETYQRIEQSFAERYYPGSSNEGQNNFETSDADVNYFGTSNADVNDFDTSNTDVNDFDTSNADVNDFDTSNTNVNDFDTSNADGNNFNTSNADGNDFNTSNADVNDLVVSNADVNDFDSSNLDVNNFDSSNADVNDFNTSNADVNDFNTSNADVNNFNTSNADVNDFSTSNADVNNLGASNADVNDLGASNADVNDLLASNPEYRSFSSLESNRRSEASALEQSVSERSITELSVSQAAALDQSKNCNPAEEQHCSLNSIRDHTLISLENQNVPIVPSEVAKACESRVTQHERRRPEIELDCKNFHAEQNLVRTTSIFQKQSNESSVLDENFLNIFTRGITADQKTTVENSESVVAANLNGNVEECVGIIPFGRRSPHMQPGTPFQSSAMPGAASPPSQLVTSANRLITSKESDDTVIIPSRLDNNYVFEQMSIRLYDNDKHRASKQPPNNYFDLQENDEKCSKILIPDNIPEKSTVLTIPESAATLSLKRLTVNQSFDHIVENKKNSNEVTSSDSNNSKHDSSPNKSMSSEPSLSHLVDTSLICAHNLPQCHLTTRRTEIVSSQKSLCSFTPNNSQFYTSETNNMTIPESGTLLRSNEHGSSDETNIIEAMSKDSHNPVYPQIIAVDNTRDSNSSCTAEADQPAYCENFDVQKAADAVAVRTEECTLELENLDNEVGERNLERDENGLHIEHAEIENRHYHLDCEEDIGNSFTARTQADNAVSLPIVISALPSAGNSLSTRKRRTSSRCRKPSKKASLSCSSVKVNQSVVSLEIPCSEISGICTKLPDTLPGVQDTPIRKPSKPAKRRLITTSESSTKKARKTQHTSNQSLSAPRVPLLEYSDSVSGSTTQIQTSTSLPSVSTTQCSSSKLPLVLPLPSTTLQAATSTRPQETADSDEEDLPDLGTVSAGQ